MDKFMYIHMCFDYVKQLVVMMHRVITMVHLPICLNAKYVKKI